MNYENQLQPKQDKPRDVREEGVKFFTEYVNAKADYDDACREVQRAYGMKEGAAKRLAELNQRVSEMTARAMNDPTEPQPNAPPSIGTYGR